MVDEAAVKEPRNDPGVRRTAIVGLVKAAIGAFLISFEFFAGSTHGFTSWGAAGGVGRNVLALSMYAVGLLLIYSAMKNCPFPTGRK